MLRVAGSHPEVGEQIGARCADAVARRCVALAPGAAEAALPYRAVTERELPWLVEELDAVADAAGVDRMALFAAGIEELDEQPAEPGRGCSDLVACGPAAADGHVWVA